MARWRKTVDIKKYLHDEEMSDQEKGLAVVAELRKHSEFEEYDDGLLLEELEDAAKAVDKEGYSWFNACLNQVYNIADDQRIWLGV